MSRLLSYTALLRAHRAFAMVTSRRQSIIALNKPKCLPLRDKSAAPIAAKGSAEPKWCSKHRSTTHTRAECTAQHNGRNDASANIASAHSEAPPTPVVPEMELGGFSFMTTPRPSQAPQPDSMPLLVHSDSSDRLLRLSRGRTP